ncbi:hypothetical protein D3C84_775190 [compost metagenome]
MFQGGEIQRRLGLSVLGRQLSQALPLGFESRLPSKLLLVGLPQMEADAGAEEQPGADSDGDQLLARQAECELT